MDAWTNEQTNKQTQDREYQKYKMKISLLLNI